MFQLLKRFSNFYPFWVDLGHIEIILQADHISSKLAIGFLILISYIKFFLQFCFQLLEIHINI